MTPVISCVIPVYNSEKYLSRCVDSVLSQDYRFVEIVLIDDGSTDNSGFICDAYAKENDYVKVFHFSNCGASLARKAGLEYSKGEYVTFVDSDDFIAPNYISELYKLIIKYGAKISACGVKRVEVNENENENKNKIHEDYTDSLLEFDELMPRFFKYEFWGFPGSLYNRALFEDINFPKATLSEDYYVKTQIFSSVRKLAVTSAPLYYYEFHEDSLSHTKLSMRAFEELENVKAVFEYAKEHCPEFSNFALSNVVETSVKLFNMVSHSENPSLYKEQIDDVVCFLRNNKRNIKTLNVLNSHVKLIALGISFAPTFMRFICKIL